MMSHPPRKQHLVIGHSIVVLAIFFFQVILASYAFAQAPDFAWARQGQSTNSNQGRAIASDSQGNTYTTGYFKGSVSFGSTVLTGNGPENVFIVKHDAAGNVVWAKRAGGTSATHYSYGYGIAIDPNGNCFVTGGFTGVISFGTITLASTGLGDIFIAKYDSGGNPLWAKKAGGISSDVGFAIAADGVGNCYVTGHFSGTSSFDNLLLTSSGDIDIFILKLDGSGNIQWARKAGGSSSDNSFGIVADNSGNSYITGMCSYTATFGNHTLTTFSGVSGLDYVFVAKYNAAGVPVWVKKADGPGTSAGLNVDLDANGNCYVIGHFSGEITFGNTTPLVNLNSSNFLNNFFLVKYNASGDAIWSRQNSGIGWGQGIAVDGNGDVLIAGEFQGATTIGNATLTSTGSAEIFVAKYSGSGDFHWAKQAGGYSEDGAQDIAADAIGNAYLTGSFRGNAFFDAHSVTTSVSLGSTFVAKLNASVNYINIIAVAPLSFCPGTQIIIPFTAAGTYNPGNVFTAELSDASGSFVSPVPIGILVGTTSGNITVAIPPGTPPGNGYRIRVNASNPLVIGNDNGINLTVYPPAVLSASASPSSVCLGSPVTLSASGATSYSWAAGNGLSAQVGPMVVVNPTAAGTFTYTVNGSDSCDNYLSATISITVWPNPTGVAGANRTICSGEPTMLGASPVPGHTYSWSPATGLSNPTIANPVLQLSHAGPADTVITYTLSVSNAGSCQSTAQVQVTVKPLPVVNAGAAVTLCGGAPGQLQPLGQQPGYSYNWSPATALSNPAIFSPSLTLPNNTPAPITTTYTLSATYNGCSNSSTVQVTINPRPSGTISGSLSVCPNVQEVSYWFTGSTINSWPFSWGVSGGSIFNQFGTDSITVNWGNTNSQAQVWALPRNNYQCFGDTVKLPVVIGVLLITPTPVGPASLCVDPAAVHSYSTFHTNGSTYQWSIDGGQIVSGQGSSQVQVQWPQPGLGKLWVLQQSITLTDTCLGTSDTLFVQLLALPDSTLPVQGSSSLCAGTTATYTLAGGPASSYQWLVPGGQIVSGQGSSSIEVLWPTAGVYSVSVTETGSNGCVGRLLSLPVQVYQIPNTVIATSTPSICPGYVSGIGYSVQGLTGSTYQWHVQGGQIVSGQGSPQVSINWNSILAPIGLSVTETSSFGCTGNTLTFPVVFDATYLQLLWVSVDTVNESQVLLHYQVTDSLNYPQTTVVVERQDGGSFNSAGSAAVSASDFTDTGLQTNQQSYRYRLQGQNLCDDELLSNEHATIWLQGQGHEQSGLVELQWTGYQGWGNQQVEYQVWRKLDGEHYYQQLPQLSTTGTAVQAQLGNDGFNQCYRILAVAADGRQSWSNSLCLEFLNPLHAPNIITPNGDGKNDVLVIEKLHLYPNSELTILNRWGKEVYRSRNYQNNWGAEGLPTGLYFYQLSAPGKPVLKGWIEVVR